MFESQINTTVSQDQDAQPNYLIPRTDGRITVGTVEEHNGTFYGAFTENDEEMVKQLRPETVSQERQAHLALELAHATVMPHLREWNRNNADDTILEDLKVPIAEFMQTASELIDKAMSAGKTLRSDNDEIARLLNQLEHNPHFANNVFLDETQRLLQHMGETSLTDADTSEVLGSRSKKARDVIGQIRSDRRNTTMSDGARVKSRIVEEKVVEIADESRKYGMSTEHIDEILKELRGTWQNMASDPNGPAIYLNTMKRQHHDLEGALMYRHTAIGRVENELAPLSKAKSQL